MSDPKAEVLAALADGPKPVAEIIPGVTRETQGTLATVNRALIDLITEKRVERIIVANRPVYRIVEG